jgi:hypothetical protein
MIEQFVLIRHVAAPSRVSNLAAERRVLTVSLTKGLPRPRLGHIGKEYARPLASILGDGNGKINCNTVSRDDRGFCPDMGGVYGNPRPLRTPSAT